MLIIDPDKGFVGIASVLGVAVCLVPCIVSDLFLTAWVGPQYSNAALYMIVMLVPLTLDVAATLIWMALYARGQIGSIVALIVPVALGNVGISLLLGVRLGMGPASQSATAWPCWPGTRRCCSC